MLREPPGQALLTLQVQRSEEQISNETIRPVAARARHRCKPPVKTEISGRAPLVRALNDASLDSLDKGELIAFPILIVLLLLVFRSPIAAIIPLALRPVRDPDRDGGDVPPRTSTFALDALALNMLTMIGLALGVDYSLLIVSRFREELAAGAGVEEALERGGRARRPDRALRRHGAGGRHARRAR